jgi:lantibiotic leader peptide-processing serine protease
MKKLGIGLILAGIVGCSAPTGEQGTPPAPQLGVKPTAFAGGVPVASRHVVLFRGESVPPDAAKKIATAGGKLLKTIPQVGLALAEGPASFDDKMAKDPSVATSAPEIRSVMPKTKSLSLGTQIGYPHDLLYSAQWNIRRVNAPQAWQNLPAGALDNVTVAVIDTGIADDHPELVGQVIHKVSMNVCHDLEPAPGAVPDREGYPEYDATVVIFPDGTGYCVPQRFLGPYLGNPFPKAYNSHGTHVAGIIGANANFGLVTGVAPGVKLAAYKIMDNVLIVDEQGAPLYETGGAFSFSFFDAVVDATLRHFNVVNMSFGGNVDRNTRDGNAFYLAWDRVARFASNNGTLLVAAAGNDATNLNGKLTSLPSDLPSVVAVGATATSTAFPNPWAYLDAVFTGQPVPELNAAPGSDIRAFYSNAGASVDLSAPGGDFGPNWDNPLNAIISSVLLPNGAPFVDAYVGTSMAAPHVAGVAALVRAKYPQMTPADVKERLKSTAASVGPRQQFGLGLVNAGAATTN